MNGKDNHDNDGFVDVAEGWFVRGVQAVGAIITVGLVRPVNRRPILRATIAGGTVLTQALVEKDKQVYRLRAANQLLSVAQRTTATTGSNDHDDDDNEMNEIRSRAVRYLGEQLHLDTTRGRTALEQIVRTNYSPDAIRFKSIVYGITLGYFGTLHDAVRRFMASVRVDDTGGIAKCPTVTLHEWYGRLLLRMTDVPPPYNDDDDDDDDDDENALLEWSIGEVSRKFLYPYSDDHRPEFWYRRGGGGGRRGPTKPKIFQWE